MRSRIVLTVAVVLVAGAAAWWTLGRSPERTGEPAPAAPARPAGPDAAFLAGELPPDPGSEPPSSGGTLTVRANAEPSTMDPLIGADGFLQKNITGNVLEALVRQDPRQHPAYPVIPALATSWTVSDDHLTYTFTLRKGVVFHDGKPFTARDVKFTFDRVMDPEVKSEHLRSYFTDLQSVTTPDDATVVLTWKTPYVWALRKIAEVPVVPAHAFEGVAGFDEAPFHRAPVGTGPFRIEAWKPHESLTLLRNEAYWGEKPHLDRVIYRFVQDSNVAWQLLLRGEIDLDPWLSSEQYVNAASEPKIHEAYHRIRYFDSMYGWLGWNLKRPLFQDARVRRALAMLLDRETMAATIGQGVLVPAHCINYHLGPGCEADVRAPAFDRDGARALLAEAGWKDTDGDGLLDREGVPFRFTAVLPAGTPSNEQMLLAFQQELYRAGIQMDLQKLEWAVMTEKLGKHDFDACLLGWWGDLENDQYQLFHSSQTGGNNYLSYASPQVDELVVRIRTEFDDVKRQELFRQVNRLVIADQPGAMLFHYPRRALLSRRVRGAYVSPIFGFQVRDLWVLPAQAGR